MSSPAIVSSFTPCAAKSPYYLHARGGVVVQCTQHDPETIEDTYPVTSPATIELIAISETQGPFAASHDASGTTTIWNLRTGKAMALGRTGAPVTALVWLGHTLVFGNKSGEIRTYNLMFEEWSSFMLLPGVAITALSPCPDGGSIAIGFENSSLFIADACEFRIIRVLQTPVVSSIVSLDWHLTSHELIVQAATGSLNVWNVKRSRIKITLRERERDSPIDGPLWASWVGDRVIEVFGCEATLWNAESGCFERLPPDSSIKGWVVEPSTATLLAVRDGDKLRPVYLGLEVSSSSHKQKR
ncbi:hypothetical protein Purlil1_13487 [Purpureocillium lilacinum]|uniref:Uncharacterized protein n=1 Tax=Purpureocillium lilacinum TaxID=33203 RepID=A0ABR0BE27_PURLI|nr:hypothetical protein Purlil1_13487 [Purpureocillium lilacinum]